MFPPSCPVADADLTAETALTCNANGRYLHDLGAKDGLLLQEINDILLYQTIQNKVKLQAKEEYLLPRFPSCTLQERNQIRASILQQLVFEVKVDHSTIQILVKQSIR